MDKLHKKNQELKRFNQIKKHYNHPEILNSVYNYYKNDSFINIEKLKDSYFPELRFNTSFENNMNDSMSITIQAPSKNTVRLTDDGYASFNLGFEHSEFIKFVNDPEVKSSMKFYNVKSDSDENLYTLFNFRKAYYNFLKQTKDKVEAKNIMWQDFNHCISQYINFLLYVYTINDLVLDHKLNLHKSN